MATRSRRKLALVIGISKYESGNTLTNPKNDAYDMASKLKSIGFILHENEPKLDLTCEEMELILVKFKHSINEGDMIVFYFAGHGLQWEVSASYNRSLTT